MTALVMALYAEGHADADLASLGLHDADGEVERGEGGAGEDEGDGLRVHHLKPRRIPLNPTLFNQHAHLGGKPDTALPAPSLHP